MNHSGIVRNIDELGRFVIPKELRTAFGIQNGDPIEISADGDEIILKKHYPYCIFCGNQDDVSVFNGKKICAECLEKIKKL